MTSKTKTIFIFIILIGLSIFWILMSEKYIVLPILIIVFSLFNLLKINNSNKNILKILDETKPELDFVPNSNANNKIRDFKYSITDNLIYLDEYRSSQNYEEIVKIDLKKKQINTNGLIPKRIDFSKINYFSLLTTKTLKTQRNIISFSYKSGKKLNEILVYVCPIESDINEIKDFFKELIGQIGLKTNIEIRQTEK